MNRWHMLIWTIWVWNWPSWLINKQNTLESPRMAHSSQTFIGIRRASRELLNSTIIYLGLHKVNLVMMMIIIISFDILLCFVRLLLVSMGNSFYFFLCMNSIIAFMHSSESHRSSKSSHSALLVDCSASSWTARSNCFDLARDCTILIRMIKCTA